MIFFLKRKSLLLIYTALVYILMSHHSNAAMQCSVNTRIAPFNASFTSTNGVGGWLTPNRQRVMLIALNNGSESVVPIGTWEITSSMMRWISQYGNPYSDRTPSVVNDGYEYTTLADGQWTFSFFEVSLNLKKEIEANRLILRKIKMATASKSDTQLDTYYQITPGMTATWDLPSSGTYQYRISRGEYMELIFPGPSGAEGSIQVIPMGSGTGNAYAGININGCDGLDYSCSSVVKENESVHIKIDTETLGSKVARFNATLSCE